MSIMNFMTRKVTTDAPVIETITPVSDSTKRPRSVGTSPDSHDAKKSNSERQPSLSEIAESFEPETPFWVPAIFKAVDQIQNDMVTVQSTMVKVLSKMDEWTEMAKKVGELEKAVEFVTNKFDDQTKEFEKQALKFDEQSKAFGALQERLKVAEDMNGKLRHDHSVLLRQVDSNEQHSRNECLLIHGVPEEENEGKRDHRQLFAEVVTSKVGVKVEKCNLRRAHRLGPARDDGKPRAIIARFDDMYLRNKVYHSKKSLKGTKMVLTESLTSRRLQIMKDGRAKYGNGNVWSIEGRIMANNGFNKISLAS